MEWVGGIYIDVGHLRCFLLLWYLAIPRPDEATVTDAHVFFYTHRRRGIRDDINWNHLPIPFINMSRHIAETTNLNPIVKWPGGKRKELPQIMQYAPTNFNTFYEPFVGGGSVFMAIKADHYVVNDFSTELINLYRYIQSEDDSFFKILGGMTITWDNIRNYTIDFKKIFLDLYKE